MSFTERFSNRKSFTFTFICNNDKPEIVFVCLFVCILLSFIFLVFVSPVAEVSNDSLEDSTFDLERVDVELLPVSFELWKPSRDELSDRFDVEPFGVNFVRVRCSPVRTRS